MGLVPDDLRLHAAAYPDRVALRVVEGPSMTFGEWDRWSNAVARGLAEAGVGRGDRVALLLPNEEAVRYQVAYVACHKAGAAAVPVNPRYARREVDHVLANCRAAAVVTTDAERHRVEGRAPLVLADAAWAGLLASGDEPFQVPVGPDDLADILYTSGTTGLPKGVSATHGNVGATAAHAVDGGGLLLHAIPLTTFVGTHGAQMMGLRYAITNLLLPSFDAGRFAGLIETERPGWLLTVPAHCLLLLESGALDGVDTSSVQVLIYGSAPMPPDAVPRIAAAFPTAALISGYGLTEAGGTVVTMPPGGALSHPGAVGRPAAGVRLRILDEAGSEVATGEVGEVVLRLPAGGRSYYDDPEATAQVWRDGWVHTGDLGYVDGDGYLYLVDRKKDLIVRGGYNVYCIEVESALHEHPGVAEAAVLGVPHPVLGQDICAVVRLHRGASLTLEDARAFLADRLADYKRPRRLVVRDEPLPRSGLGKVDKKALAAGLPAPEPGEAAELS